MGIITQSSSASDAVPIDVDILPIGERKPQRTEDVVIAIDLVHDNRVNETELNNTLSQLETIYSNTSIKLIKDKSRIESSDLSDVDLLIIIGANKTFSLAERETIKDAISKKGMSLLIAEGFANQTESFSNELLLPYGVEFNITSEQTMVDPDTGNETNLLIIDAFTEPRIPATTDLTRLVMPNSTSLTLNTSLQENYTLRKETGLLSLYPLVLKNNSATNMEGNILSAAVELQNGARIIAISSENMFDFRYMPNPLATDEENRNIIDTPFNDNDLFVLNATQWLSKVTGYIKFTNQQLKEYGQYLKKGSLLHGEVSIMDWNTNASLDNVKIFIYADRIGHILTYSTMQPANATHYVGILDTSGIGTGWLSIRVYAERRGYYLTYTELGKVFLNPDPQTPQFPNLMAITVFGGALIIVLVSGFNVWTALRKEKP